MDEEGNIPKSSRNPQAEALPEPSALVSDLDLFGAPNMGAPQNAEPEDPLSIPE